MRSEIRDNREEIMKERIKENQKVLDQLQQHKNVFSELETKYNSLELRLNLFEKTHRKNNIIISGLDHSENVI